MNSEPIYFDNSMAARPSKTTLSEMIPILSQSFAHPLSPHKPGALSQALFSDSVKRMYRILSAGDEDTILFTSSGAEAVNHVIFSTYMETSLETGKNHFVVSSVDEAPALMAISRLEELSCKGTLAVPDEEGKVTRKAVEDCLTPRTALVSLSFANGLTGVINSIKEIGELCQERGVLFHVDATHVIGKLHFSLKELQASFLTASGEPFHAPSGTGFLFSKAGIRLKPFIMGGIEQGGLRGGILNACFAAGFAEAYKEALESQDYLGTEIAGLRDHFEEKILKIIPDAQIFFRESERLPHITVIAFPGVVGEALLFRLNQEGIYACIGGGSFQQLSLHLTSSGIPFPIANCSLSFSFSRETREEEIERAVKIISEQVSILRRASTDFIQIEEGK
jgi:cysteine desulfurase